MTDNTNTAAKERMAKARAAKAAKEVAVKTQVQPEVIMASQPEGNNEINELKAKVAQLTDLIKNTQNATSADDPPAHYANPRDQLMNRASGRPQRLPMGQQNVLNFDNLKKPGFVYRLVNDVKDGRRINSFLKFGWEFVEDPYKVSEDKRINKASRMEVAACQSTGGGVKSYLMCIREDWYKEYQQLKNIRIDDAEKGLVVDESKHSHKDITNTYGGVSIKR